MEVIHEFQANLTAPGNPPVLHAVQYDGARQITAQLYAGTAVWAVPEGATAGITYTLPNRQSGYYETLSDGTAACTIVGNTVTAVLAPVLTSIAGEARVSIVFTKDGTQLSTFPFRIRVDARPGEVNPGAQPDAASPFVGKLYYGGGSGFAIPLGLGDGVRVEQNEDGSLWLVVEGGSGGGGGISTETANIMISKHNSSNLAHSDIRLLIQGLTTRLNTLANSDDVDLDQLAEIVAYIKSNKSLIDAITTSKVSVADIVDNLVTLAHDKPLSAAMGVSLAGEIDALRSAMPSKVSQLQNDKGYLTEHQDISHLLPREELPEAVEDALAQAKASGEFDGPQGPQGEDYVLTDADKAEIVAMVLEALSGKVISGYVDEDNNIIINNLPDGTYTVKYEMADGSTVEIGDLVLDTNVYYTVTNTLTNCVSSNSAVKVAEGSSYEATITADAGYELESVAVTMGGSPVVVSGVNISIEAVTGDIVVTAVAKETAVAPSYTNLLPLATDADGNPYNGGKGYKSGYKMSTSSGNESATSGAYCSGFMPVSDIYDVIRVKNVALSNTANVNNFVFYDSSKAKIGNNTANGTADAFHVYVEDEGNGVYMVEPARYLETSMSVAFFRFSCGGITDETIVTVNEEIV